METLIAILIVIGLFFLSPFIEFLGGWIVGWLIEITVGTSVINGLSLIGLNLSLDQLPLFFGTIAVISSFFETYRNNLDLKK